MNQYPNWSMPCQPAGSITSTRRRIFPHRISRKIGRMLSNVVSIAVASRKAHCPVYGSRNAMRHILSSFLALHWAVVFALLAFLCIDGNRGVAAALGVLGVAVQ